MSQVLNGKWRHNLEAIDKGLYNSSVRKIDISTKDKPIPLTKEELAKYKLNRIKKLNRRSSIRY